MVIKPMARKYVPRKPRKVTKVPFTRPAKRMYPRKPRINRALSTLPFPKVRNVTFNYKYPGYTLTSGALSGTVLQRFKLNSMFDFDSDNNLGNKQPLYFDQMFGADGPYRFYKVNAWRTTITVTNLTGTALHVYYDPGAIGSSAEADTQLEAQNRPGVIYRMLTGAANAKPQCKITSFKTTKSFAPKGVSSGLEYGAAYNADPTNLIVGTLLIGNLSVVDLTSFNVVITVQHTFYSTCYLQDANQS